MKKLFVNGTEIPESAMQSAVEQMLNFYAMQGVPPDALKAEICPKTSSQAARYLVISS